MSKKRKGPDDQGIQESPPARSSEQQGKRDGCLKVKLFGERMCMNGLHFLTPERVGAEYYRPSQSST